MLLFLHALRQHAHHLSCWAEILFRILSESPPQLVAGEEKQEVRSGFPRPDFSLLRREKSVPSGGLKIGSPAPIFLTPLSVRGTFPSLDPVISAGAPGAILPPVAWREDGPLSCSYVRVNFFFPLPSLSAELDRLTGSRPRDDRPAPPKRSLGVMSREAKADSSLSGRRQGSM